MNPTWRNWLSERLTVTCRQGHGSRVAVAARTHLNAQQLEDRCVPSTGTEDMVMRWHSVAMDVVRDDHALTSPKEQFGPTRAARALGIVQAAVYDAVVSINHAFQPYKFTATATPDASIDAAVAQAAHDTLAWLYPTHKASLDVNLATDLAGIPAQAALSGKTVGTQIASQMIAWRATDHSADPSNYTFGITDADWQSDPLHSNQKPLTANWGSVTPFTMASGSQFRPPAPPSAGSDEYAAAYKEVYDYGGDGVKTPTVRTEEQTEIGIFWGYDGQPGLCSPPRLYNQIVHQIATERGNTLLQNARLLALLNLAQGDAGISSWEAKFYYNLARPVTAIRAGDLDGNPNTQGNPTWTPYGAPADNGSGTNFTPPFPAYTSGHATFGGAVFETLRKFYGRDDISFTFLSDEFNGKTFDQHGVQRPIKPRHFDSLSQAEEENGQSRIYLGIHWAFDKTRGIKEGNQVADNVFDNFLRANPAASRFVVAADVGGGPRVRVIGPNAQVIFDFYAFDPSFTGGVRVAQGDMNGDGVPDVIATTSSGTNSVVKVFDGTNLAVMKQFSPFETSFSGGNYVASGDVNGDGKADIIVSAGESGGPRIKIFSGKDGTVLEDFFAFDSSLRTGAHVAAGDVNADGRADLIAAPGVGGGSLVRIFTGATATVMREFFAYDTDFRGGIYLSAGDCDSDGKADVITGAGAGGGPHVKVFDANGNILQSYLAFSPSAHVSRNGVRVGSADMDGDGRTDLLTASGPGDAPVVECRIAINLSDIERLYAFEPEFLGGVNV